ncbi:MAG: hypothetical protein FWG72_10760, partial [Oscillospiraceae bacterium]|nr:hypothetical protein [Oscillospiraceae bacterium]
LGAAALRGFQLTGSFAPRPALIERGAPVTVGLIVLFAVFTAAAVAYALVSKRGQTPAKPAGTVWFFTQFAALAALLAASGLDLRSGFAGEKTQWGVVCLSLLGLFSCGALLMIALNINKLPFTSAAGFWATVPVFWACLTLVADFWGQMGNPVRNTFIYGMLATVCCTLALYTLAGFFFDKVKPGRVLLFAFPGIYFAILTSGGFLLGSWLGDPVVTLSPAAVLRLAFMALHLTAAAAAVLYGRFTPPVSEPEPELVEEDSASA